MPIGRTARQIKALMQVDIIIILAKHGYPPMPSDIYEKIYNDILEQTESLSRSIPISYMK